MQKSLKVCLLLSVNLFFVIVANAGIEKQKGDDKFSFWDLPDELQDNIWEKVGNDIPSITKNLLLKSYCRKISGHEENFDPAKAKIIANNLDPMTVKKSVAQDVLQLPQTTQKEIEKHFVGIHKYKLFKELKRFSGHSGEVEGILFDNEGNLVSWSEDCSIRIWDINTGQILSKFYSVADKRLYLLKARIENVILDNNGHLLACLGTGTVAIWNIANKKLLRKIRNGGYFVFTNIILDKKGRIFSTYNHKTIRIWDLDSGKYLQEFPHGRKAYVRDFILDEHNGKLLSQVGNDKVYVWDIESGKFLRFILLSDFIKKFNYIRSFMLNGDDLFVFLNNGKILRLNLKNDTFITFEGHKWTVFGGALDKKKKLLFTYSIDATIRLWDIDNGECLRVFGGHTDTILGIILDEQGYLISWAEDFTIRIWNIETGECINSFKTNRQRSPYENPILVTTNNIILDSKGRLFLCDKKDIAMLGSPETLKEKMETYLDYIRQQKEHPEKLEELIEDAETFLRRVRMQEEY